MRGRGREGEREDEDGGGMGGRGWENEDGDEDGGRDERAREEDITTQMMRNNPAPSPGSLAHVSESFETTILD